MGVYRLAVLLLSGGAVYALYKLGPGALATSDLRSTLGVLIGASASLLGFLVASGALLYAVANTTLARNLQRTGHFQRLLGDLFFCAGAFFFALLVGAIGLFVPGGRTGIVFGLSFSSVEIASGAVVFTQLIAYLLLIPVGHKMWLLLSNIQPDKPNKLE